MTALAHEPYLKDAVATASERFWSKVEKTSECWLWHGSTSKGYGRFVADGRRAGARRSLAAHRFAYELLVGPIPDGLMLDHLCRVRNCVNPRHLEPVTHRENVLRGISPVAVNAKKTHCENGHELTPENVRYERSGRRRCRACDRRNSQVYYERNREQVLLAKRRRREAEVDRYEAASP